MQYTVIDLGSERRIIDAVEYLAIKVFAETGLYLFPKSILMKMKILFWFMVLWYLIRDLILVISLNPWGRLVGIIYLYINRSAEYCDWEKLNDSEWSELLGKHPQLIRYKK